jgi:methyl-accepting chemotaxis protein
MEQIVSSVRKVHDIMAEITEAGQRQSQGIDQIGSAINDMDQTTQQNAALVEEASAAAESLSEQTIQLSGALAVFKLEGAPTLAAPAGKRLALTRA